MKYYSLVAAAALGLAAIAPVKGVQAADYVIDTKGAHAFVQFRVKHLGYSWLYGRFNTFSGEFSYDADKPEASAISVTIDTTSVDSNHAERDKHLRSGDFLNVSEFPQAKFVSTGVKMNADGTAQLMGDFTLHGVTKPIAIDVNKLGEGKDPWGGYRAGFQGSTTITMADYGMTFNLGPASTQAEIILSVEGVKK
ncbi:YceI family protein [Magnetovibrio sp. PR-2]|uniref:YceI family protein n=1 Tax=Magnetovibrio sp. PR-2 TaxID=3120356 RepID=UPI002FCE0041